MAKKTKTKIEQIESFNPELQRRSFWKKLKSFRAPAVYLMVGCLFGLLSHALIY